MVDEGKLCDALSVFARTMTTDSSVEVIADRLIELIVEVIPGTSAGITLVVAERALRYTAASDESALEYEQLHHDLSEQRCADAGVTGVATRAPDQLAHGRFPLFADAATPPDRAVADTFPLRHDGDRLGAMTVHRNAVGLLGAQELIVAQTFADLAAAYLVLVLARDDARADAAALRRSSLRDHLTDLPNRQLLEDRLEHAAEHARRNQTAAAVLFADLDQFKQVNDEHGHNVGDTLLVAVARRLSTLVRASDTLARISGDEFVFLCENLRSPDEIDAIIARIADAFAAPFESHGYELMMSASVGVAYAGAGEEISTRLIVEADKAMYEAKRTRYVK